MTEPLPSTGGPPVCQPLYEPWMLDAAISPQSDLPYLTALADQLPACGTGVLTVGTNEDAWALFLGERLRETYRLTLEHFHLFEWFPLCPGRFHLPGAKELRDYARTHQMTIDGEVCYAPVGKAEMLIGGVGAVRLAPVEYGGSRYFLMTASSTGVCHEGFPVAVPEMMYRKVVSRVVEQGAAPVRLSGEMRHVSPDAVPLFDYRQVPLLMLHATELDLLPAHRPGLDGFAVSAVATFTAKAEHRSRAFVTFYTFDPADHGGPATAARWIREAYAREHNGTVVTDFDQVYPKFPEAKFGLPRILGGKLDLDYLSAACGEIGIAMPGSAAKYIAKYVTIQNIQTNSGTVVGTLQTGNRGRRRKKGTS